MGRFENPVCVFGIRDGVIAPFDLEVAGGLFEEGRSGEVVHVEFGFGRHCCEEWIRRKYVGTYRGCGGRYARLSRM